MRLGDLYKSPDDDDDIEEVERLFKAIPNKPEHIKKRLTPEADKWEADRDAARQKWIDAQNRVAEDRLAGVVKEVIRVLAAFKQDITDREGEADKEYGNLGLRLNIGGSNTLGHYVDCLFEIKIKVDPSTKKADAEVFSYWIDNEGTIDPTSLMDEETIRGYKEGFAEHYYLETPKLPDFGAQWLNNLAYFCWALPQLQNEVGLDDKAKEGLEKMRHNTFLKNNDWGTYKLQITIKDAGVHTYYEEGTPQNLVDRFGPETIIISKMS